MSEQYNKIMKAFTEGVFEPADKNDLAQRKANVLAIKKKAMETKTSKVFGDYKENLGSLIGDLEEALKIFGVYVYGGDVGGMDVAIFTDKELSEEEVDALLENVLHGEDDDDEI